VTAPSSTDSTVAGMVILTEFQKPTLTPVQFTPAQALDHALVQADQSNTCGKAKICAERISSMLLNEVISIT
jgi:hypothetical protein